MLTRLHLKHLCCQKPDLQPFRRTPEDELIASLQQIHDFKALFSFERPSHEPLPLPLFSSVKRHKLKNTIGKFYRIICLREIFNNLKHF